jgi:hypothetical protein
MQYQIFGPHPSMTSESGTLSNANYPRKICKIKSYAISQMEFSEVYKATYCSWGQLLQVKLWWRDNFRTLILASLKPTTRHDCGHRFLQIKTNHKT